MRGQIGHSKYSLNKHGVILATFILFLLALPLTGHAKTDPSVKNTTVPTSVAAQTQPSAQQSSAKAGTLSNDASGNDGNLQTTSNTLKTTQPLDFSTNQPLSKIFRHNAVKNHQFTSSNYLLKVFIILGFVLGLFYVLAKLIVPKFTGSSTAFKKSSKPSETSEPSLLKSLFQGSTPKEAPETQPYVLHRTRLSQTKEIHVIEVGGKFLVVGSTPSQMTLLTEFTMPQEKSNSQDTPQTSDKTNDVYKKYLSPGNELQTPADTMVAADEEIVLLNDYEDQFEHS